MAVTWNPAGLPRLHNRPDLVGWKLLVDADFTQLATDATPLAVGNTITCGGKTFTVRNDAGDDALNTDILGGSGVRFRGTGVSADGLYLLFPTFASLLEARNYFTPVAVSVKVRMAAAVSTTSSPQIGLQRRDYNAGDLAGVSIHIGRNSTNQRIVAECFDAAGSIEDTSTAGTVANGDKEAVLTLISFGSTDQRIYRALAAAGAGTMVDTEDLDEAEAGGAALGVEITPAWESDSHRFSDISRERFQLYVKPGANSITNYIAYLEHVRMWALF